MYNQDQLNLYAYVGNDPVNKVDPNGLRVFLATRMVTPAVTVCTTEFRCSTTPASYHLFLVSNADYVGDPKARIYSWGPTAGRLQRQEYATDRQEWERTQRSDATRYAEIDADDALADEAAAATIGYPKYSIFGVNSNSAAYRAAQEADKVSGSNDPNDPTPLPDVWTPGSQNSRKVEFRSNPGPSNKDCIKAGITCGSGADFWE